MFRARKIKADNYVSSAENKSGQLCFERGKFHCMRSVKHAVLAFETLVHLESSCICTSKLVYLIKHHNSANYQLNSRHAISSFRLFDLLSLSYQPVCLLINAMTVYFFWVLLFIDRTRPSYLISSNPIVANMKFALRG
jgi:hypothetical protein